MPNSKYPVKGALKVFSTATDFVESIHEWVTGASDYHERNVFSLDKHIIFEIYQKKRRNPSPQILGRHVTASVRASSSFTGSLKQ